MGHIIKLKRGPAESRENFIPDAGEIILDTTNNLLYIGDGTTPGGLLITNSSANIADKIAQGDMMLNNTRRGRKFIIDNWEDVISDSSNIEGYI